MKIETEQVVLTLTPDKNILSALRANKAFRTDEKGNEYLVRQFDSQSFEFRAKSNITVGKTVAAALKRDTSFVMGDHLTGAVVCPLVEVGKFDAGKGVPGVADLSCPYCHKEFKSAPSLGRHLYRAGSECPEYKEEAGDDAVGEGEGGAPDESPATEPVDEPFVDEPKTDTPQPVEVGASATSPARTTGSRIGRQT